MPPRKKRTSSSPRSSNASSHGGSVSGNGHAPGTWVYRLAYSVGDVAEFLLELAPSAAS